MRKRFINKKVLTFALLLCAVCLIVPLSIAFGKYIMKISIGSLYLTVNADRPVYLLAGTSFNKQIPRGTTEIIFDLYENYPEYRNRTDGTPAAVYQRSPNSSNAQSDKIQLFQDGTTVYVLSENEILANPYSNSMFYNCQTLTSIRFNSFNTSDVTTMQFMFGLCFKLANLDVKNFDTSNVNKSII